METKQNIYDLSEIKVGDGVTIMYYSDCHAMTVTGINGKVITAQRDTETLNPTYNPHFIPGGFAAHCTNQNKQKWICTPNPNGTIMSFSLRKNGKWVKKGESLKGSYLTIGRYPYYDYNF